MRKFFVKLFNLVYLAGAAVSIWALVTRPVINSQVGVSLTSDQVADRLMEMFNKSNGTGEGGESGSSEGSSYRVTYRDETPATKEKITREDIKNAFPNGFSLQVGVKIEAKDAFNLKNKELLKKSIAQSIENSLNNVVGKVSDGLHTLIKTVTEKLAKDELKNQINAQINQYFNGATLVTDEEVNAVYDNVYNTINQEGDVTVDNLANAIVGEKDPETGEYPQGTLLYLLEEKKKETGTDLLYSAADPQPTQEEVEADIAKTEESEKKYYIEVVDDDPETEVVEKKYVHPEVWGVGATYYVQKYDASNVSGDDIADKLAQSLNSIPGLVEEKRVVAHPTEEEFNETVLSTKHYYSPEGINAKTFVPGGVYESTKIYYTVEKANPQPTQEQVEAELTEVSALRHYVEKTSEGYAFPEEYAVGGEYFTVTSVGVVAEEEYYQTAASTKYKVLVAEDTYEFAKIYDATADYYIETKIVNDVDTALAKLIEQMLGNSDSQPNRAHLRFEGEGEGESSDKKSKEELEEAIKDYIYKLIPIETINKFTETADQYSTYVVIGVIALLVFPWALFALVTLIRTFRRNKCWTKPWIVFVFAFIQVILGIGLTYGTKYVMPLLTKIPKVGEFLEQIQLSVDIRTGCLIPSFIYCGFIVLTIIYAFFAHGLKVEYKLRKREEAMERYRARHHY